MKKLYEAENGLEAHMIVNLLEQAHLNARVDGEFLQGAVGEIQASGVVRVMVDEGDYDAAKELIKKWDAEPPITSSSLERHRNNPIFYYVIVLMIGAFIGASLIQYM
ncbi:hypothetical protein NBRC116188_23170 [Oceaniserpentilla sp. 4NH20-0058]|uniref:putative signal transducing protein n=1 Tax=Oceaniserpentilla sp. 4NH20-0058 TaxID=3127660 RepID=UPI00310B4B3D